MGGRERKLSRAVCLRQEPGRAPALFVFICDKELWKAEATVPILSVGEVREEPVRGTDYATNMNKKRENSSAKFLNLGSANTGRVWTVAMRRFLLQHRPTPPPAAYCCFPPQGQSWRG